MRIETTRFGPVETIDISADTVLTFAEGPLGFEAQHRFARLPVEIDSPFSWLQSLDDRECCFLVAEPGSFFSRYRVDLETADVESLDLQNPTDAEILVVLVVYDEPERTTANLLAPIVLNRISRAARQVVLRDSGYPVRTPLLSEQRRLARV